MIILVSKYDLLGSEFLLKLEITLRPITEQNDNIIFYYINNNINNKFQFLKWNGKNKGSKPIQ